MLGKIISVIVGLLGRILKAIGHGIAWLVEYALSPQGRMNRMMAKNRQRTYRAIGHSRKSAAILSMLDEIEEGRLTRHDEGGKSD